MKILLVESEPGQGLRLRFHLQQHGHQVLLASHDTLAELTKQEAPDLVLANVDEIEISGTRPFLGRDGTIAKLPFVLPLSTDQTESAAQEAEGAREKAEQITKRIKSLRRGNATRVRVGELNIRFDRRQAFFRGVPLRLTPIQFKLLGVLALNARRVVSHRELLEQVWGYPGDDEEAKELSKVHINRIRQKMRAIAPEADLPILSVRGFGYMLLSVKR